MSMYSMHFYTEGCNPAARLANPRFQYLLWYHACRLAWSARGPVDDRYHEDLYQEAMLAAWRILERDPGMYGRTLVRLCVLAMYAARRRGRSVFRADPADRKRVYESVVFDPQEVAESEQWIDWNLVDQLVGDANEVLEGGNGIPFVDPSIHQW